MTDEEIVDLVQKKDEEKYGEIIERYEGKLKRYVRELINQREEIVEDLVEESLIKGYINIQGFDCRKKFSSWIYRIAHNAAVDFMKKKRARVWEEWREETEEDKGKSVEELIIEKENEKTIHEALKKMEEKYREVIWLYYFEDKSYDEIADILETTTGNVGVMMMRAKEKLKRIIRN